MSDTIAGRYTLIDPIARGGTGTVWRAWDQRRHKLCAAKVLRQRDSADLLRFVREQSVKLEHPHVLAPYGWAAEDEHVVIAMDLCSGGTLETVLQDHGAVSDEVVEEIMLQLLQALRFVHAEGWIHRDVKPANLMMNATGMSRPMARLADFGIATQIEDARLTRVGTVVGTPGYIAPELLEGADPNPAQDLFAAGVVAMRMIRPHHGRGETPTPEQALEAFGEESLLGAEIAALLDPDPTVRHDGALALQERLTSQAQERIFDPAHTRDGESLEIFQTLDPLPRKWQEIAQGERQPPGRSSAVAGTVTRDGDIGDIGGTGDAGQGADPSTRLRAPEVDLPSGGWVRTSYGLVSTPTPGGEPLVGPSAGPTGAVLNGMPSGLAGDGSYAPSSAPPTDGGTTGSVVQGPLPQNQPSRGTLLGGVIDSAPRPGLYSPAVARETHQPNGHATNPRGSQPPREVEASHAHHTTRTASHRTETTKQTSRTKEPMSLTGWMVIVAVVLTLVTGLLLGVMVFRESSSPAPSPTPGESTGSSEPTSSTGPGNGNQNNNPTIGGIEGNDGRNSVNR